MPTVSGLQDLTRGVNEPSTRGDGPRLRLATPADVTTLKRVLVRAFDADPFYNWLVRQGAERDARMDYTFEVTLRRMSSELNETHTTDDLAGAAIWKRPGDFKLPLARQLQLLPAFVRAMGWSRLPAFLSLLAHMEELHDRLVPEPHFYLFVLGVDPDQQRRGLGGQLLMPVLARCDQEHHRAYLETSRSENLSFYSRHGFELARVVEREGCPKFWLMTREPCATTQ